MTRPNAVSLVAVESRRRTPGCVPERASAHETGGRDGRASTSAPKCTYRALPSRAQQRAEDPYVHTVVMMRGDRGARHRAVCSTRTGWQTVRRPRRAEQWRSRSTGLPPRPTSRPCCAATSTPLGDRRARLRPAQRDPGARQAALGDLAPATVGVVHRIVAGIFKAAVRDRRSSPRRARARSCRRPPKRVEPLTTEAVQALTDAIRSATGRWSTWRPAPGCGRASSSASRSTDRLPAPPADGRPAARHHAGPGAATSRRPRRRHRPGRPAPPGRRRRAGGPPRGIPGRPDGLVFTTELGEPIRRTAFSARLAAGGEGGRAAERRHLPRPAALLREPAHPARRVGEDRPGPLGHASAAETLDTYATSGRTPTTGPRAAVDAVLGRCCGLCADCDDRRLT